MTRTLTLVIGTGPSEGASIAALRLVEHAMGRGDRVAIYAYGDAVGTGAEGSTTDPHIRALLREGAHGGRLSWIVDAEDLAAAGGGRQVEGIVTGDGGDLWRLVREADVVLGVSR